MLFTDLVAQLLVSFSIKSFVSYEYGKWYIFRNVRLITDFHLLQQQKIISSLIVLFIIKITILQFSYLLLTPVRWRSWSNDINMLFKDTLRHGKRVIVPPTNKSAQQSIASHYEHSFGVSAAKLWNLLPASVNSHTALEPFKIDLGKFLESFPDTPPLDGYTPATNNSLLEWNLQKSRHLA